MLDSVSKNLDFVADPADPSAPSATWTQLFVRICEVVGLTMPTDELPWLHPPSSRDAWCEHLIVICSRVGLRARCLTGGATQIMDAVGPDHPVVMTDREGGWLLLTDRRGSKVQVEGQNQPEAWWTSKQLSEQLTEDEVRCVAIDPPSSLVLRGASPASDQTDQPPSPWARLRSLIRMERHDVVVTFIYALAVGLLTLATPIAVQALVNSVAFGTLMQPLLVLTFLLVVGLGLGAVFRGLQVWVVEILQRRLFVRLVGDLSYRLPRVDLSAFDRAHGPELVNRFFDLFTIQKATSSLLIGGLEIILTATLGMAVLAFYHPLLLAFDGVLVAMVIAVLLGLGRRAPDTAILESKAKYQVAGWLEEVARHPIAFKLAGGPNLASDRADALAGKYLKLREAHFSIVFRQIAGALSLQVVASAGVLGLGGWLVIQRQLTLGQLVASELIVTLVVASVAKLGKHLETLYDLLAAVDKVGQLVDLPLERHSPAIDESIELDEQVGAEPASVELQNVEFAFGRRAVLRGADLKLAAGDRAAVVGLSGAGRSTLADLLLGLRPASRGQVIIGGENVKHIHPDVLRLRAALVRGDEVVVGDIAENVAFGRPGIGQRRVREALAQVGMMDAVDTLPEGLSTKILPGGAPLSRAQAARLTLARAIAGRPSLLVLDRALDGFDPETQGALLDTVLDPSAPWTVVVMTDSDQVASRCGRRFRLSEGRLEETA